MEGKQDKMGSELPLNPPEIGLRICSLSLYPMEGKQDKMGSELPLNPPEIDTSDDEVDYSVKPEFYDSDLDQKDELWVHKIIKGRSSDAVLSCPACFTTLCLDCQWHEKYLTQYRAMFVMNCKIKLNQILRERSRRPKKRSSPMFSSDPNRLQREVTFKPVCCSVCLTEVGIYDEDEVYHFFNVLASES